MQRDKNNAWNQRIYRVFEDKAEQAMKKGTGDKKRIYATSKQVKERVLKRKGTRVETEN